MAITEAEAKKIIRLVEGMIGGLRRSMQAGSGTVTRRRALEQYDRNERKLTKLLLGSDEGEVS